MTTPPTNPAYESQGIFRRVMEAFAAPGEIKAFDALAAPAPLASATAALVKCLNDFETPIWLDPALSMPAVTDWIRFHTGASVTGDKRRASFALIGDVSQMPDFSQFALGSEEYPNRSTTIIAQVMSLQHGDDFILHGPGIKTSRLLRAEPLPPDFEARLTANRELFPRGIDLVLVADNEIAALPRSVRVARRL
jgi:alpha-D-ribose 1-methylphosphonate 5-triphosphate synthase subunit PhnH